MIGDEARSLIASVDARAKVNATSPTRDLSVFAGGIVRRVRGYGLAFRLDNNGDQFVFVPGDAKRVIVSLDVATSWFMAIRKQLIGRTFCRPAWMSMESFCRISTLILTRKTLADRAAGTVNVSYHKWIYRNNWRDIHTRTVIDDSDL